MQATATSQTFQMLLEATILSPLIKPVTTPHPLRSREDLQDIKIIVIIYYISLGYQLHHSEVIQIVPINIMNLKNQETVIIFEHRDFRGKNDEIKVQICRKIREKISPHNNLLSSNSKE